MKLYIITFTLISKDDKASAYILNVVAPDKECALITVKQEILSNWITENIDDYYIHDNIEERSVLVWGM